MVPGRDEPRQVDELRLPDVEPAGLVGRVEGGGDEACRDEDEDDPGELEEAGAG